MLGMRTTVLSSRFRFTILRLHFASENISRHNPWHRNIMAVSTYMTEALKQHTWIPAISRQSRLRTFFSFAVALGNLRRAVLLPLSSTLKKFSSRGICALQYVNYQNVCVLELHWSLEFLEGCIFRAVWLKTSVSCKRWSASLFQQLFPLFKLSSIQLFSALSKANSVRPQNLASESLKQTGNYFFCLSGNVTLKRSRWVGTVPVFSIFLSVDSGTSKASAIDLLLSAAYKLRLRYS